MEEQIQEGMQETTVEIELLPARYAKTAVIGQGGMGLVFRARDQLLERDVAIKLLNFEGSHTEVVQLRFLQEAKALASLDHVNIVKILGSGVTDNRDPYHVLEFLEGEVLSAELNKSTRLSSRRFFELLSQICDGLIHAHDHGVVHRDLKPSNIFLCRNTEGENDLVRIIDFGIARLVLPDESIDTQTLTRTNLLLGSPAYMSPEQCRGKRVDHRSDIYSLGCIMYECLTGTTPFPVISAMEVMYKHMHEEPPKLEAEAKTTGARSLAKLVDRCLLKDPQERPQSVEAILLELKGIFSDDLDLKELRARKKIPHLKIKVAAGILALAMVPITIVVFKAANTLEVKGGPTPAQKQELVELQGEFDILKAKLEACRSPAEKQVLAGQLVDLAEKTADFQATKLRSSSSAEATLNRAMTFCDRESLNDKLLMAKMLSDLATIHYSDGDQPERDYAQAVQLISEATKEAHSSQEDQVRRSIIRFHVSKSDFVKAKEDFQILENIWKENKSVASDVLSDRVKFSNLAIVSFVGGGIIANTKKRIQAVDFALEVLAYVLSQGDYTYAAQGVLQCIRSIHDAPKDSPTYKRIASRAFRLLSQIEAAQGELELSKKHAAKADRLSK